MNRRSATRRRRSHEIKIPTPETSRFPPPSPRTNEMVSNKYKKAGYKITVKPCKASPPVFVWPPKQIIAYYHLEASADGISYSIEAYIKLDKDPETEAPRYVYEADLEGEWTELHVALSEETNTIDVDTEYEAPEQSFTTEATNRAASYGKTALYDLETWDAQSPGVITCRLRFSL